MHFTCFFFLSTVELCFAAFSRLSCAACGCLCLQCLWRSSRLPWFTPGKAHTTPDRGPTPRRRSRDGFPNYGALCENDVWRSSHSGLEPNHQLGCARCVASVRSERALTQTRSSLRAQTCRKSFALRTTSFVAAQTENNIFIAASGSCEHGDKSPSGLVFGGGATAAISDTGCIRLEKLPLRTVRIAKRRRAAHGRGRCFLVVGRADSCQLMSRDGQMTVRWARRKQVAHVTEM